MSTHEPAASRLHPTRVGLEPQPFTEWLRPRPGDEAVLAERARLIANYASDVIAALPEAYAAVMELAAVLQSRGVKLDDAREALPMLTAIGRSVAEDLCILTPAVDAPYRLTAGVLCFPNRWRLVDKIGGTVLEAHGPVPEYAGHMSQGVDHFLARLKLERAYMRRNWGLTNSAELFLPQPTPALDPRSVGPVFLRQEEQSFLKLPQTGAIIFAIRTTVTPWVEIPPDLRSEIVATIDGLSAEWLGYKSLFGGH